MSGLARSDQGAPVAADESSIRRTLEDRGASAAEAREIVEILGRRLAPQKMHSWPADPEHAHGVPDPASVKDFGVVLNWTPVNAVAAGKTRLVIDEARRYAGT